MIVTSWTGSTPGSFINNFIIMYYTTFASPDHVRRFKEGERDEVSQEEKV